MLNAATFNFQITNLIQKPQTCASPGAAELLRNLPSHKETGKPNHYQKEHVEEKDDLKNQ